MMEFLQQISGKMREKAPPNQQPQGSVEKRKCEKAVSAPRKDKTFCAEHKMN